MSSFHGDTITTTASELVEVCWGFSDENSGENKVNFEFTFQIPEGQVFYVYDWKEYRTIDLDENIEFHIGANSSADSREALEYLYELIN
tara:strand:+ start:237 stop:503 length:267 start_codon:yes stop_codon:yes gene_type:complete